MSPSLFGTDGIRGIPGEAPLVADTVRRVGRAAGRLLKLDGRGRSPKVVLGRDTRRSGPLLGRWLAEGLACEGLPVWDVGVLPTPALSLLARRWDADFAVVISASHNPAEFNGIKFFSADGLKLSPQTEAEIEKLAQQPWAPASKGLKTLNISKPARAEYLDFLRSTFPAERDLSGLRIVVDCAHGAASALAPGLFKSLGAEVFALGCSPSGANINLGVGAIETGAMQEAVLKRRAHCGVSFDGDADRAVFADEKGRLLDGDHLIAILAEALRSKGMLRGDRVVATVMSNRGLLSHLASRGTGVTQVPVGDRQVTVALLEAGLSVGGEASGHIVLPRFSPSGDGMLTALQVLAALKESGGKMSGLRRFELYPQLLENLPVERKVALEELPGFQKALRAAEARLGREGRVFVRYSGTEPILRIMAEGPRLAELKLIVQQLTQAYRRDSKIVHYHHSNR